MNLLLKCVNDFIRSIRVEGAQRQSCKRCGAIDYINFDVPDHIWSLVAGEEWAVKVLCLSCFDDLAMIHGIDYAPFLSNVVFVGNRAGFEFEIKTAHSYGEQAVS